MVTVQRKRWQWVGISDARMTFTVVCTLMTANTITMVTSHSRRPANGIEGGKGHVLVAAERQNE